MPPLEPDIGDSGGRRDIVVPLVFLGLSVVLMILPPSAQQQLSIALRSSVLAPFLQLQEAVQQARARSGSIERLQVQLDSALARVHSQSTLAEENERLRALLDLRRRGGAGFVPATAIRPGTQGSESMFLLDVGSRDGVEVNQPVVVAGGLIGVVREVGSRSALAMDWTHPDFRVSAMTVDGEVFGIIEPRRGIFREEDRLLLNGVPYHTSVELQVPVVTSGQGSVYPRGILVGTVDSLAETEAGWRRSYWLEPAVRPGSATHVLVFTGSATMVADSLEGLWLPRGPSGGEGTEAESTDGASGQGSPSGAEAPDADTPDPAPPTADGSDADASGTDVSPTGTSGGDPPPAADTSDATVPVTSTADPDGSGPSGGAEPDSAATPAPQPDSGSTPGSPGGAAPDPEDPGAPGADP